MADIVWTIAPDDVEWEYDRTGLKANLKDNERIQALPDKETMFEDGKALAVLLMNEVIFLNSHWWEDEWPEKAKKLTSLNVNCNDVFAWGCADAEELPHDQIESLYHMWQKDPSWGPAVWCMIQRNQMPQKPVEKIIREMGIWDLDALKLGGNTMDAEVTALVQSIGKPTAQPSHNDDNA